MAHEERNSMQEYTWKGEILLVPSYSATKAYCQAGVKFHIFFTTKLQQYVYSDSRFGRFNRR
jgi:hypothetical protein